MTYSESAEGIVISRARALIEVRAHYASVADFDADMGVHTTYLASAVLSWLGY